MARQFAATDIVRKLSAANPRRRGSRGYKLWDMYKSGDTVGEIESRWDAYRATLTGEDAKKAGAVRLHLAWDVTHGDISIDTPHEASVKPRETIETSAVTTVTRPLTIAEAKAGLAMEFNVPPSNVDITIRG